MERSHDVVPVAPNTLQHAARLNSVLSCPICLGMMLDPLITACCQNNFCRRCLEACLRGKPECPLCRASLKLENTLPNRALRNLLPHNKMISEEVDAAEAVVAFRPMRLSRRVPTRCLLLLLVFSTAGLIAVLLLGSGCLSASAALRGDGFALSSLAWCRRAQKTETEPDVITAVSDASSTRSLIAQGWKHSTSRGEPVRSPSTFSLLEQAGIPSRSSTHLPSAEPTGGDGAPSERVARAVYTQAAPHGRFGSPFALQPPAPAEEVGMAWRRTKGRPLHGSHGPGPDEAIDRVRSIESDAPWRREARAEALERGDGVASLLSIVPA